MFNGTFTAIVTPFREGKVDEAALRTLVEQQVAGGVEGVVPVGTTGESPTLDYDEHIRVIEKVVEWVGGLIPVVAGTGGNSTSEAVYLTREAARVGATATLQVAPYYNKPQQEGVYQHFRKVAEATPLPILLYSIPGRCGIEIAVDTVLRLFRDCPTVQGIKEAGGTPDRVSQIRAACGSDFSILSGDDSLTLPFMAVGATGVVSVASNVAPRIVGDMVRAARDGDWSRALSLHDRLYPLFKDLFMETNPVPVKAALARGGWMTDDVRLPLVPASETTRHRLDQLLTRIQPN
jgi:4-hydroxy-tetrahydrodipicolinate synthase